MLCPASRTRGCAVGARQQGQLLFRWRHATAAVLVFAIAALTSPAALAIDAKKVFNQRCTACHTFGKGVKVGPDLKGVTSRRQRPWLISFVRASSKAIKAGDPVAVELYRKFKQQRMPDWTDLSPAEVGAIMDWLAADGPEQKQPDERDAESASATDLAWGRALFDGRVALANGGLACGACHSVRDHGRRRGGTLGPELTETYLKFRDRALTTFLRRPCTPRHPESSSPRYLAPEEAFALKAFLREVAVTAAPFAAYTVTEQKRGQP
jgi:mono/diheme cytochrome c family protein